MSEEKNKKWTQIFYSRWFLPALFLMAILLVVSYVRAYYQEYEVRQQIEALKSEISSMQTKKIETIELLKYSSSTDFVEEKARTELNLIKPGEKVAFISNLSAGDKSIGQSNSNLVKLSLINNPIKWFKFFFLKDTN